MNYVGQQLRAMGWLGSAVTIAIIVGIVALFVYGYLKYFAELKRARDALATATGRIKGPEHDKPQAVFPQGPDHFRDMWSEFLTERERATRKYHDQPISTIDPADVFSPDKILGGYNHNFAVTLAGVFTGLGIFGTFVGLVIGMASIEMDSAAQTMSSVRGLLGGMSAAFWTSIAGVFFSLLWLYLDRNIYNDVQRASEAFFSRVRRFYPVETADQLLHRLLEVEEAESTAIQASREILREHTELLKSQTGVLQDLSFDLATRFQEALDKSLQDKLVPTLTAMVDSMQGLAVHFGERQSSALDQMIESFQDRLSQQMQGQFENLVEALAKAAEWQEVVHADLKDLSEQVQSAAEAQRGLAERTSTAVDQVAGSMEGIATSADRIVAVGEQVTGMASALNEGLRTMSAAGDTLGQRIHDLDKQQETYRTANEKIREELARHIDALSGQIGGLEDFWTGFRDDLQQTATNLRSSASEFEAMTAEKLREIFVRFDSEMATVVDHLSGTLAEIREVTNDLPRQLAEVKTELGGVATPLAAIPEKLGAIAAEMNAVTELAGRLKEFDAALRSLDGRLGSLDGLPNELGKFSEAVTTASQRLAQSDNGRRATDASSVAIESA